MSLVLEDGRHVSKDRVYNLPLRLRRVLAHEERLIAPYSTAQQACVWWYLVRRLVDRDQLHFFTLHGLSWHLGPGTQRDLDDRTDAELVIIRPVRLNLPKHSLRWVLEFNQDLGGPHWQVLAGPDVERHISPSPAVDKESDRGERLYLRIGSNSLLLAIATVLTTHHVGRIKRPHGLEEHGLLVANSIGIFPGRRLHRQN